MKKIIPMWIAVFLTATVCPAAEKTVAGPKGGRLLDSKPARAEFFVNKDRKVEITFYDADLKPVALAEQSVEVRVGKDALRLEPRDGALVSATPLPGEHEFLVVVRITPKSGDKPQNFRIQYHDGMCGGCKLAEYACTCDDHGAEGGGHHH